MDGRTLGRITAIQRGLVAAALCLIFSLLWGCQDYSYTGSDNDNSHNQQPPAMGSNILSGTQPHRLSTSALTPIPDSHSEPVALAALGQQLFNDPLLSHDQTVSCASCHKIDQGGDDNLSVSVGIRGQQGQINAPTVLNSSLNFRQFWDGRAATLQEQARFPVENPIEMGSRWPEVIDRLSQNPEYQRQFDILFNGRINISNITLAIASFERTLLTPNSPFDRFLKGEISAITEQAQQGYQRFQELGCVSCHQGVNIGGNMYQYLGIMRDYFAERRELRNTDYGLYNHTGREIDRFKFKVPSLRNVVQTAPYFHDGSAATLRDAIIIMGRYQLGIELSQEDQSVLLAFLTSLSAPPLVLASTGDQPQANP